ncbi:TonB-dependent receptor [Sphingomonas populi]|uniref:TonB-dependent receptor n=1 Tax=Sphingomonas populi TaxID=2484750 RepID=A0A4V2DCD6_9SPHN|nr:TonB-dependent receptor [Sphingomonas populi]RZF61118.1 TonB-dependent receptor [Sphingomonas populi]
MAMIRSEPNRKSKSFLRLSSASTFAMATFLAIPSPISAQQSPVPPAGTDAAPAKEADASTEIVVTGSRIARRDYVASSPIVTQNQESIEATGRVNIESAMNQLPQFVPAEGETSNPLGGGGRATLDLRGLGPSRTLVLLDGRRLPTSSAFNVVDVNIIPNALVESVEVISGGASAVYGSDAIAGVVNFKTRKRMNGIELDAQSGISDKGDAAQYNASITAGTSFANGRGSIMASGSYTRRDELLGRDRRFYDLAVPSGNFPGSVVNFGANRPSQAVVDRVFGSYGVAAGSVPTTSILSFNDDGTLLARVNGINSKLGAGYGLAAGSLVQYSAAENTIVSAQDRYSGFGRASFDVSPNITAYAQVLYTFSRSENATNYPTFIPNGTAPTTNPFIPQDLRTILASRAQPNAPFIIGKRFVETPKRYYVNPFHEFQALAGIRGNLGSDTTFDIYASHGRTTINEELTSAVQLSRVQELLNAPDGGRSICAGGYNPFGVANSLATSAACVDYITTPLFSRTVVDQDVIEGSVSGKLFKLPAGDIRYSLSAGYRKNRYDFRPDVLFAPIPGRTNADLANTQPSFPTSGSTSVKEIAGELLVPVLKDSFVAESLNLSLGYRYSKYQYGGGVSTYKAEADWTIRPGFLLRGGFEHAIRAPNVGELFSAPTGVQVTIGVAPTSGDPCDSRYTNRTTAIRTLCLATGFPAGALDGFVNSANVVSTTVTGNKDLQPEVAETYTAGVVLSPKFSHPLFAHLTLSVDYYNISVDKAISVLPASSVINKCFNLDGSNPNYDPSNIFCSLMQRDRLSGSLTNINTPYFNLGGFKTSGIDIQFDARWNLSDLGIAENAGTLTLNTVATRLSKFEVQLLRDQPVQDFAGTIGNGFFPRWRALTSLTYARGGFSIGGRWRHYASLKNSTSVTAPASPSAGTVSYDVFDLVTRARVTSHIEFRGGINNVADQSPLIVGGQAGTTDASVYDIIGRSFYLGAKVTF